MPFEEKTPENPNDDCDDAMGLAESSDDSDAPRVKYFGDENHVDRMGQNVSRAGREGNATPPPLKKKRIFGKTSPEHGVPNDHVREQAGEENRSSDGKQWQQ